MSWIACTLARRKTEKRCPRLDSSLLCARLSPGRAEILRRSFVGHGRVRTCRGPAGRNVLPFRIVEEKEDGVRVHEPQWRDLRRTYGKAGKL